MGWQESIFMKSEGDAWYERNKDKPFDSKTDPVISEIGDYLPTITNMNIVEIGSGRGHRIGRLKKETNGICRGFDPSAEAIYASSQAYPDVKFGIGTATGFSARCHILIYGFCLYLCDREDIPLITNVGDHNLINGGYLIIHDFDPAYPHKTLYKHIEGIYSYKMDYSKLWLANPAYSLVSKTKLNDETAVWVLKKAIYEGWPEKKL